jgi:hypothetical protein
MDKPHMIPPADNHIAINPFKRGAGDNRRLVIADAIIDKGCDGCKPRLAVVIIEGLSARHFGDIFSGVKTVCIPKSPVERFGQFFTDGAFSGTGDAHHKDDARGNRMTHDQASA